MSKFDFMLGNPMPEPVKKPKKRITKKKLIDTIVDNAMETQSRRMQQLESWGQAAARGPATRSLVEDERDERRRQRNVARRARSLSQREQAAQFRRLLERVDSVGMVEPERRRRTRAIRARTTWLMEIPEQISSRGVLSAQIALLPSTTITHRVINHRLYMEFYDAVSLVVGMMVNLRIRGQRRARVFWITEVFQSGRFVISEERV